MNLLGDTKAVEAVYAALNKANPGLELEIDERKTIIKTIVPKGDDVEVTIAPKPGYSTFKGELVLKYTRPNYADAYKRMPKFDFTDLAVENVPYATGITAAFGTDDLLFAEEWKPTLTPSADFKEVELPAFADTESLIWAKPTTPLKVLVRLMAEALKYPELTKDDPITLKYSTMAAKGAINNTDSITIQPMVLVTPFSVLVPNGPGLPSSVVPLILNKSAYGVMGGDKIISGTWLTTPAGKLYNLVRSREKAQFDLVAVTIDSPVEQLVHANVFKMDEHGEVATWMLTSKDRKSTVLIDKNANVGTVVTINDAVLAEDKAEFDINLIQGFGWTGMFATQYVAPKPGGYLYYIDASKTVARITGKYTGTAEVVAITGIDASHAIFANKDNEVYIADTNAGTITKVYTLDTGMTIANIAYCKSMKSLFLACKDGITTLAIAADGAVSNINTYSLGEFIPNQWKASLPMAGVGGGFYATSEDSTKFAELGYFKPF